MMHINFLVIKGDCIKIPAIKDEFFSENITLFNQEQQDFIVQEAKKIGGHFWIGLKRQGASKWKWLHSKKVPQFKSWKYGNPHNRDDESRLANLYDSHYNWVDWHIDMQHYPICQYDL